MATGMRRGSSTTRGQTARRCVTSALNFEAPVVRDADGYQTLDYGLDLIVHGDGRREWKDVPDLHAYLRSRPDGRTERARRPCRLRASGR